MRVAVLLVFVAACGGSAPPAPPPVTNEVAPVAEGEPLRWDEFEREFMFDLLAELQATSERDGHPRLGDLVVKVEALIRQAEHGELTRALLLERYEALVAAMTDPVEEYVTIQLDDLRALLRKARVAGD